MIKKKDSDGLMYLMFRNVVGIERVAFPDRSSRQATRAAWRQSQCVASGTSGGSSQRAVSALSGSVSSSSSLSSLGPTRPCAAGPITADTSKYLANIHINQLNFKF